MTFVVDKWVGVADKSPKSPPVSPQVCEYLRFTGAWGQMRWLKISRCLGNNLNVLVFPNGDFELRYPEMHYQIAYESAWNEIIYRIGRRSQRQHAFFAARTPKRRRRRTGF